MLNKSTRSATLTSNPPGKPKAPWDPPNQRSLLSSGVGISIVSITDTVGF